MIDHQLKQRNQGGFSLLELIIVLVIIGILVAAVTMTLGDKRADDLRLEARRLSARIAMASDEAILTGSELGMQISRESYRFLTLEEDKWQQLSNTESHLRDHTLPPEMLMRLEIEGLFPSFSEQQKVSELFSDKEDDDKAPDEDELIKPQLFILSSGELNPFRLLIGYDDPADPIYYLIEAQFDGKVEMHGPYREPMDFGFTKDLEAEARERARQRQFDEVSE